MKIREWRRVNSGHSLQVKSNDNEKGTAGPPPFSIEEVMKEVFLCLYYLGIVCRIYLDHINGM